MSLSKRLQWNIEYVAYRGVDFLLGRLSPARVHRIGGAVGRLSYHLFCKRRHIVRRNLRVAFGQTHSPGELDQLCRCVFERTGANLFSSLRSPNLTAAQLEETLEIRNLDKLRELLAEGKGVIMLTPHMGNWELLAQIAHFVPDGRSTGTHYRPLNNPLVDKLVKAQRSQRGTKLFAKRTSPMAMSRFLREGGMLGILADLRIPAGGLVCSYYGRMTACSPLPEVLAKRTGAAVMSISLRTLAPGKWRCTFEHVTGSDTASCMAAMEEATRRSPSDVFWFQDRWRIVRTAPFSLPGKLCKGVDPASSDKPVRLLIWLDAGQTALPELPPDVRPDLTLELACPSGTTPPEYDGRSWDRVWPTDPSVPHEQFAPVLAKIDAARQLPLDAIVTVAELPHLTRAAKKSGIPTTMVAPPDPDPAA